MTKENLGTSCLLEQYSKIKKLEAEAGRKGANFILGTSEGARASGFTPEKVDIGIAFCDALLLRKIDVDSSIAEKRKEFEPVLASVMGNRAQDDNSMGVVTLLIDDESKEV